MSSVKVINIDIDSHQHTLFLKDAKPTSSHSLSTLNNPFDNELFSKSLINLLAKTGLVVNHNTPITTVSLDREIIDNINSEDDRDEKDVQYFYSLLNIARENTQEIENKIIVFNFINLELNPSAVDKFSLSCLHFEEHENTTNSHLIFLTRDCSNFENSALFNDFMATEDTSIISAIAIDLEGFYHIFKRGEGIVTDPDDPPEIMDRSYYQGLLNLSPNQMRDSLIYQTNINIGHFEINNSHVRTHYDLSGFVNRPNVFEFIYNQFVDEYSIQNENEDIKILATGIETGALNYLGSRLSHIHDHISYELIGEFAVNEQRIQKWCENKTKVIILTDVINSGSTVSTIVDLIINSFPQFKSKLLIYSVVKMDNSPEKLSDLKIDYNHAVKINRDYYEIGNCVLCDLNQPLLENINSLSDFSQIVNTELTPLDFWELVEDSDSLELDPQKEITFKVSTIKLMRKYSIWITNILTEKVKKEGLLDKGIDTIISIDEEGGDKFSQLVAKALEQSDSRIRIKLISRAELDSPTKADTLINCSKAVIVDDGINSGKSMSKMLDFVKLANIDICSIIVLDNRLKTPQMNKLIAKTESASFIYLYTWAEYYT